MTNEPLLDYKLQNNSSSVTAKRKKTSPYIRQDNAESDSLVVIHSQRLTFCILAYNSYSNSSLRSSKFATICSIDFFR